MPAISTPKQTTWDSNIYVVAMTRVLVIIGVSYLIKSLYQLIGWSCFPPSTSTSFPAADARFSFGLGFDGDSLDNGPTVEIEMPLADGYGRRSPLPPYIPRDGDFLHTGPTAQIEMPMVDSHVPRSPSPTYRSHERQRAIASELRTT
ncbi:MAG: hypothetical protein Q9163_001749 [Psora crenata]